MNKRWKRGSGLRLEKMVQPVINNDTPEGRICSTKSHCDGKPKELSFFTKLADGAGFSAMCKECKKGRALDKKK